jgi:hypothetical protein
LLEIATWSGRVFIGMQYTSWVKKVHVR